MIGAGSPGRSVGCTEAQRPPGSAWRIVPHRSMRTPPRSTIQLSSGPVRNRGFPSPTLQPRPLSRLAAHACGSPTLRCDPRCAAYRAARGCRSDYSPTYETSAGH